MYCVYCIITMLCYTCYVIDVLKRLNALPSMRAVRTMADYETSGASANVRYVSTYVCYTSICLLLTYS